MNTFYDSSMFPDIFDDMSDYHNSNNYKFNICSNTFNQYINAKLFEKEVDDLYWINADLINIFEETLKYPLRNYVKYGFYGIYNKSKTFREKSSRTFYLNNKQTFCNNSYKTIQTFDCYAKEE